MNQLPLLRFLFFALQENFEHKNLKQKRWQKKMAVQYSALLVVVLVLVLVQAVLSSATATITKFYTYPKHGVAAIERGGEGSTTALTPKLVQILRAYNVNSLSFKGTIFEKKV